MSFITKRLSLTSIVSRAPSIISHFFNWQCGQLFVRVEYATNLDCLPTECFAYYCVLRVNKQETKTTDCVINNNLPGAEFNEPNWSESFFFDVFDQSHEFVISVWGKNILGGQFLGQVIVPISSIADGIPVYKEFALERTRKGGIFLKLSYSPVSDKKKLEVDDFNLLKVLGKGTYGKVMLVQKKDSGQLFAMKVLRKDHMIAKNSIDDAMTERNILIRVRSHPFIVSIRYSFQTHKKLYIILDYISGGELFFHLTKAGSFPESQIKFYVAQLASAIGYLHSLNIMYRDLKLENILMDLNGYLVLTDFGLAQEMARPNEKYFIICGSTPYMAPEMLQEFGYGKEIDYWSLGILAYEMRVGLPPFFNHDKDTMVENIKTNKIPFDAEQFSPDLISLISGLLERDPTKRLGFDGIRNHPFFAELDWEALLAKKLEAPFIPHLQSPLDVRYFDHEFTSELPRDSYSESPCTSFEQSKFKGFSYVAEDDVKSRYYPKVSPRVGTKLRHSNNAVDIENEEETPNDPSIYSPTTFKRTERGISDVLLHDTDLIEF